MASNQREVDLLIFGATELATPLGSTPRGGEALGSLRVLEDGAVAARGTGLATSKPCNDRLPVRIWSLWHTTQYC